MPLEVLPFLMWLAGPGLAWVSEKLLEALAPFDGLSGNGKLAVAFVVSTLCGLAAVAAQQYLAPRTELVAALQPYAYVVIPSLSFLVQQLEHGRRKSAAIEADPFGDDGVG